MGLENHFLRLSSKIHLLNLEVSPLLSQGHFPSQKLQELFGTVNNQTQGTQAAERLLTLTKGSPVTYDVSNSPTLWVITAVFHSLAIPEGLSHPEQKETREMTRQGHLLVVLLALHQLEAAVIRDHHPHNPAKQKSHRRVNQCLKINQRRPRREKILGKKISKLPTK